MAAKKRAHPLPDNIKPMLAQSSEPFDSADHLFEIKWDGTRCLSYIENQRLRLLNRREIEMRSRYPELQGVRSLPAGTILDAEIIVLADGRPSFNKLQQREHLLDPARIEMLSRTIPATMMVFDLLYERYENLMAQPLSQRRQRAEALIGRLDDPHIMVPDYVLEQGKHYFEAAAQQGLEGIMAKRLDSPYLPGRRSAHWNKIKVARTGEFEIIGYTQREGQPVVSALILGMRYRGRLIYKGKVGSGFTEQDRREFYSYLSQAPPLENPPANGPADAVWRSSGQRCTVRFFEKTKTGMLRAPVFVALV